MAVILWGLLGGSTLFFAGASLLFLLYARRRRNDTGFWASVLAFLGWVGLTAGGALRFVSGQAPLGSFSDGLLFLMWLAAGAYFALEGRWGLRAAGAIVFPVVAAGVAYAFARPDAAVHSAPNLESPLVIWHATLVFAAYAAFAWAGMCGFLYLIQERELKSKRLTFMHFSLPSLDRLERLGTALVGVGQPFLTVGIVLGALWSRSVWGAYLPPDPKLLWALLTWMFYTVLLALLWARRWRGRRVAILTLVGLLAVAVNYLGITFAVGGVHRF